MGISRENVRLVSDWHRAFLVVYVASVLTSPAVSADTFQQLRCLSIAHGTTRSSVCKCTFMTCRVWSVFWFHSEEGVGRVLTSQADWGVGWWGAHTFVLELMIVRWKRGRHWLQPHPPPRPSSHPVSLRHNLYIFKFFLCNGILTALYFTINWNLWH